MAPYSRVLVPQARYQPGVAQALADLVIDVLKADTSRLQVWPSDFHRGGHAKS
jgi:hypothetical protein